MRLKTNQNGDFDPLIIPLIVSIILVVGLSVFGIWSYSQFLDQRDNLEQKVAVAVDDARVEIEDELEADFAEREKNPNLRYLSDPAIGSIQFEYPKTWSSYFDEDISNTREPLNAIFHPKSIPTNNTRYALRMVVDDSSYVGEIEEITDFVQEGAATAQPVLINGVSGTRIDGSISDSLTGAMLLFPLRDKTVRIWTESEAYLSDFNSIVQDNLTFDP